MTTEERGTTGAAAPSFRARINRNTHKLWLPVPLTGLARFSIKGVWRKLEEEGPDPTVVILRCRAKIAKRTTEHRLTHDNSFQMPETTQLAELQVLYPSDDANLEVTITPVAPGRMSPQRKPEQYLERRAA